MVLKLYMDVSRGMVVERATATAYFVVECLSGGRKRLPLGTADKMFRIFVELVR